MPGQHDAILAAIAVPVLLLFRRSLIAFFRSKGPAACLQLTGSGCLVIVVLAHVCEAFRLLPRMGWGEAQSPGHYLDLASALLGLGLSAIGFAVTPLTNRRA